MSHILLVNIRGKEGAFVCSEFAKDENWVVIDNAGGPDIIKPLLQRSLKTKKRILLYNGGLSSSYGLSKTWFGKITSRRVIIIFLEPMTPKIKETYKQFRADRDFKCVPTIRRGAALIKYLKDVCERYERYD